MIVRRIRRSIVPVLVETSDPGEEIADLVFALEIVTGIDDPAQELEALLLPMLLGPALVALKSFPT